MSSLFLSSLGSQLNIYKCYTKIKGELMRLKKEEVNKNIDEVCSKWDFSGNFTFVMDGEIQHDKMYGYQDRSKNVMTKSDTVYTLDAHDFSFAKLAVLKLIDQGVLKLKDKLDKYFPNLSHGHEISVEHVLREKSGLVDYFFNHHMVDFENDKTHQDKSVEERLYIEKKKYYSSRDINDMIEILKDKDLEYKPGDLEGYESESNTLILVALIEQLSDKDILTYVLDEVLKPLGIMAKKGCDHTTLSYKVHNHDQLVAMEYDYDVKTVFQVKAFQMKDFLFSLLNKELYSKRLWPKLIKQNKRGESLLFYNANGYAYIGMEFLGFGYYCYFNYDLNLAFSSLVNEHQQVKFIDNEWHAFRPDSRQVISALVTQPRNTKMVRLNKKNFWHALELSIEDHQNQFVLNTKSSIAMALMYESKQAYVQMEGDTCVGLLVLDINKKKEDYNIDIIIIDKRYQGRGYGKHMVKWGVDKLKDTGARKLTIGVDRTNIGAKKIYMNAGFKPNSVHEGGMELVMYIDEK